MKLKWWDYAFPDFNGVGFELDINLYLDEIQSRIEDEKIKPYTPKKLYFTDIVSQAQTN